MVGLQLRSAALAYRSAADQLQAGHGKSLPENELRDVVFIYSVLYHLDHAVQRKNSFSYHNIPFCNLE